ncbi:hypothetical protein LCGC14_1140740 [marine sediment metagenome]|uniref:Uncharacterized protein n=1 Tax=marine sediment metagenome TaxID=412755 RepID=A0A0F9MLG1_9ZZZZ
MSTEEFPFSNPYHLYISYTLPVFLPFAMLCSFTLENVALIALTLFGMLICFFDRKARFLKQPQYAFKMTVLASIAVQLLCALFYWLFDLTLLVAFALTVYLCFSADRDVKEIIKANF